MTANEHKYIIWQANTCAPNQDTDAQLAHTNGLVKSANTTHLYLPRSKGGLQLPSISTTFEKLMDAKAAFLMSSRDSLVRHLASQQISAELSPQRQVYMLSWHMVEVM